MGICPPSSAQLHGSRSRCFKVKACSSALARALPSPSLALALASWADTLEEPPQQKGHVGIP